MKVLTFAWVRTLTGEPEITVTSTATTVGDLLNELITTRPGWQALAEREAAIRCARNQQFVERDAPLAHGDEIAFFPPVTGG